MIKIIALYQSFPLTELDGGSFLEVANPNHTGLSWIAHGAPWQVLVKSQQSHDGVISETEYVK